MVKNTLAGGLVIMAIKQKEKNAYTT